ncbi:serine/threonine-protein kinase [Actinomadura sp. 6N118]|uniref:serine/threonine-protein kinase n=1 Tax=Actinomadura sp. 6N118 TaxID=3375151 RepID=UPI0037B7802E
MSDPQRVGPYKIIGRLGSGGMGWVYLGRSPGGLDVAVKVVRPEYAEDPAFLKRFKREVNAARSVSGAFTAAVVDADTESDPPWLATEYVPGPSLMEVVQTSGPFQEAMVRRLGAGLVEALQAIHAAGLVHRDLKPSNILLADNGPRVIDFGISLADEDTRMTREGLIIGTPSYMSPEQMGGKEVGAASDVFSLGGVLAFTATGKAPFGEGTSAMYRIVHQPPPLDQVPPGVRDLIGRCLTKAAEERPSLEDLLDELLVAPTDVAWPPPEAAERIRTRAEELAAKGGSQAGTSMRSCLFLHAQALLDAGLTDQMVTEAVSRGRS